MHVSDTNFWATQSPKLTAGPEERRAQVSNYHIPCSCKYSLPLDKSRPPKPPGVHGSSSVVHAVLAKNGKGNENCTGLHRSFIEMYRDYYCTLNPRPQTFTNTHRKTMGISPARLNAAKAVLTDTKCRSSRALGLGFGSWGWDLGLRPEFLVHDECRYPQTNR